VLIGKVPALTTPEGTVFESNAMARYIARKGNNSAQLLGADAFQQSIIDAWIDFTAFYLNDVYPLFAFLKGYGQYNAETFQKSQEKQATAWGQIEAHLKRTNNKFLTGDAISLADIIMISTLYMPLQLALDAEFRSAYPKTEAMFRSLCDTEQVKKVIGDIQFVEKFTAPQ
jgi:elongation factor 1-gamma